MGLFTKKQKLKFAPIPSTKEQDAARSYLSGLQGTNLSFPEQQVAGLTDTQQQVQNQLRSYLSDIPGDYETAKGYYRDVLDGNYDPATSQYYQGIRSQLDTQKSESQAQVRRTAQKAGSARSTPFLGIEAKTGQAYDSQKDVVLGNLLQQERQFRSEAAQGLSGLNMQQAATMTAADQLAERERQIQQEKFNAAYQKVIQDMLAPFQYNAQIASALLNEQRYVGYQTGGGLSDLGFVASLAGGIGAGQLAGGGTLFGFGGSGA